MNKAALAILASAPFLFGCPGGRPALEVTHGPVIGEVSHASAIVHGRGSGAGRLHVTLSGGTRGGQSASALVDESSDFAAQIEFSDLEPETVYDLRLWLSDDAPGASETGDRALTGRFRTAPPPAVARAIRIAWGGDVAGQNVCRDRDEGFPIFDALSAYEPDVFVALGDMIYADGVCTAAGRYGNAQMVGSFGPSTEIEGFRAHWRYVREDPALARFLATTPSVAIWDDHEVVNDFGPRHDSPATPPYTEGRSLMPIGLRAFLEWNPLPAGAHASPPRLYRSLRFGKHLELFVLDTRSFRDANPALDRAGAKSLLGAEQREWLVRTLAGSDATWRVVVSSVPMAIPTGSPGAAGRDGWAGFDGPSGFESELIEILRALQASGVRQTVWITTDVHFAEVLRHVPFPDVDPEFLVYEAATGPLHAGLFPNRELDPTLHPEVLFFHGPESPEAVTSFPEAKRWFNFGALEVDLDGNLVLRVLSLEGATLFARKIAPSAAR